MNTNENSTIGFRRSAILKCIFHKSNQYHRRNQRLRIHSFHHKINRGMMIQTELLQIHILAYILQFTGCRNEFSSALRIHIAQDSGKLHKSRLRFVRSGKHEGIQRIKGIKKEMRINLGLIKSQFRLVFLCFDFLP